MPPQRVAFLRCLGLKTGIHFAHFGLESDRFSRELRECINVSVSFQFQIKKKEKINYANSNWILRNHVGVLV